MTRPGCFNDVVPRADSCASRLRCLVLVRWRLASGHGGAPQAAVPELVGAMRERNASDSRSMYTASPWRAVRSVARARIFRACLFARPSSSFWISFSTSFSYKAWPRFVVGPPWNSQVLRWARILSNHACSRGASQLATEASLDQCFFCASKRCFSACWLSAVPSARVSAESTRRSTPRGSEGILCVRHVAVAATGAMSAGRRAR